MARQPHKGATSLYKSNLTINAPSECRISQNQNQASCL